MTLSHAHKSFDDEAPQEVTTSELLIQIVESCPAGDISIGHLIDGLGERAFGMVLLALSLPTGIPGPPGIANIFGAPLIIFAAQLMLGHERPWLPGFIRRRRFSQSALLKLLKRVQPALAWLERFCRPRILILTERRGERWLGAFILLCSIVLMNPIPIPFSHLPLGVALAILSLGYVERDGIILMLGVIGAILGVVVNLSLTGSLLLLGFKFVRHLGS